MSDHLIQSKTTPQAAPPLVTLTVTLNPATMQVQATMPVENIPLCLTMLGAAIQGLAQHVEQEKASKPQLLVATPALPRNLREKC